MTDDTKSNTPGDRSRMYFQETHVAPGGKAFVVQHGNIAVYQWRPEYRIEQYDFNLLTRERSVLRAQPSRMLRAQYEVVPFDSGRRQTEMEQLSKWRDQEGETSAVLVHGPGGQGKTRLASHIAEASSRAGWNVVRAVPNRSGIPGEEQVRSDLTTAGKAGVMLVVDYAERWPISSLLALLQDPMLLTQPSPLRFLLLSRPAGTWWQSISYRINNDLHIPTSRIRLRALADRPEDWSSVIEAARDAFLDIYAPPEPIFVGIPQEVIHGEYTTVLSAHMAALALVDATVHHRQAPLGSAAITRYLLGRERTYWIDLHHADPVRFPTDPTVMGRTVYTATLTQPLLYEEGVAALHRIKAVDQGQKTGSVLADHAICYPPRELVRVLEPLYPDRLGEDFIALSTPPQSDQSPTEEVEGDIADPWAAEAIGRLLGTDAAEPAAWLAPSMSTLIETAKRWPHIADEQLIPIVRKNPRILLLAGGVAIASFADLSAVPIDLLEEIERILPAGRSTEFVIARAAVTERLAKFRLERIKDPVQQAAIYFNLRQALSDAGLHDKEKVPAEETVRLYRMLAQADPEKFMVWLAIALDAYSTTIMYNGDIEASVRSGAESVAIYTRLHSVNPRVFAAELARTLTNLGNSFLRMHLFNEALQAQQAAVRIRRSISQGERVESDDLGLAQALVQLSVTLSHHERLPEALDLIGEAVEIFRSASTSGGLGSEYGVLAHALEIKARTLILMDSYSEAMAPLTEAIDVLRPLVSLNSAVHSGLLAQTLSQLGVCHINQRRTVEGIEALREAVEIFSRLPDRFGLHGVEPNYLGMICNLGAALVSNGEEADAVPILIEAVEKSRLLLRNDPYQVQFLPLALHHLALALSSMKRWESALPASEESELLYRQLVSEGSATYIERWHKARDLLASVLDALGMGEEASVVRSRDL